MSKHLNEEVAKHLLSTKQGSVVKFRENTTIEFKESYNQCNMAEYIKDFAAFANNKGGYLIFGVKDKPRRELVGLKEDVKTKLENLDQQLINGQILDVFSGTIVWEHEIFNLKDMSFAIFYIEMSQSKPIMCKKNYGKNQEIRDGEIYYRYGAITRKICFHELESIINKRIEDINKKWINLTNKIGTSGVQNAAVLDLRNGNISKDSKVLVVDKDLLGKLQWIKEGEFVEKKGAKALKLVGDVQPIKTVETVRSEKINIINDYPLSASELSNEIKKKNPSIKQNYIWQVIKKYKVKDDQNFSAYNFRSKKQETLYYETKKIPPGVPSIFKQEAIDHIINLYLDYVNK